MRTHAPLTAAAAVLLASGCFYPADRGALVEDRLDKLVKENKNLKEQLTVNQGRLDEAMGRLEKALGELDNQARRSDADIGVQMQKTIEDVSMLRGQVETYQYRVSELENQIKKANDDLDKRAPDAPEKEARKKADELKKAGDPKPFLKFADDKAKAGEVVLARSLYGEFLMKWPKDELAGDAHFQLGETYFTEDRCREALYEFGKVIQEFGKADVAPKAYLRSSECFKKLKMAPESKLALEELVKQFPKSDDAKTAKARLAELDKGAKSEPKGKKTK
jgi:TolA-binding protein